MILDRRAVVAGGEVIGLAPDGIMLSDTMML